MGAYTRDHFARTIIHPAADVDRDDAVVRVPYAGTITAVSFIPDTAMAGVDTNYVTLGLVNKGLTGGDTRLAASRALTNTVNLVAHDEFALTVTSTTANVTVVAGDVLAFRHAETGTNVAVTTPPGLVRVSIRAD